MPGGAGADAEEPPALRLLYFGIVLVLTVLFTLYTVMVSKRLSEFLETLSDERLPIKAKLSALVHVWTGKKRAA